ncbi:hypothetical protein [Bradyrhizobium elkanii]|nr:hypothetical protein [Bradyrhizobium elkanii]MCS3519266.1 hypothetical protein [Bradyrhizobium elkanii]MCS4066924.1 hypothetical protein [Bradyrhizobium elkanii]MCS4082459.1 hypothetical protein [Bradyrhizobium elkanii]MCW2127924.1 hypothetical protein [Bradyrhizobium elkanii]MCW2174667.1 hypothetical protein [Bradyrhizobium elkanii]
MFIVFKLLNAEAGSLREDLGRTEMILLRSAQATPSSRLLFE